MERNDRLLLDQSNTQNARINRKRRVGQSSNSIKVEANETASSYGRSYTSGISASEVNQNNRAVELEEPRASSSEENSPDIIIIEQDEMEAGPSMSAGKQNEEAEKASQLEDRQKKMADSEMKKAKSDGVITLDSDSEDEKWEAAREKDTAETEELRKCSTRDAKIEMIRKNGSFFYYNEREELRRVYQEKKKIIENDAILRQNLESPSKVQEEIFTVHQAKRAYTRLGLLRAKIREERGLPKETLRDMPNANNVERSVQEASERVLEKNSGFSYSPPLYRFSVLRNISLDPQNRVPVYCDLPRMRDFPERDALVEEYEKWNEKMPLPKTLGMEYISKNELPEEKPKNLKISIAEGEKVENQMNCGCKKNPTGMTCCRENKDCRCFKINMKLRKMQKVDAEREQHTDFSTFGKIVVRDDNDYYDSIGFSCSENCGCGGECDNNVLYTLDKHINGFELFRHDEKEFGVRATTFIPAGRPVLQFVGVIGDGSYVLTKGSGDYAYNFGSHLDKNLFNFLRIIEKKTDTRKKLQKVWTETDWYVDPKEKGNESRYVCHGCHTNVAMIRVFQDGFWPHQCKCVLISTETIWPGSQLCLDYGDSYTEAHLKNIKCKCNTFMCQASDDTRELLVNAPLELISDHFRSIYRMEEENWRKYIERKDDIEEAREERKKRADWKLLQNRRAFEMPYPVLFR